MKIGILLADELRDILQPQYGDYAAMFERLLDGRGWRFAAYDVRGGVFPAAADACDGYIISGSRHGVYDDLDWIASLTAWTQQAVAAGVPVVGICFGHQLVAQAMGGVAGKSDKGWGLGLHRWRVSAARPAWLSPAADELALLVSHQDQVTQLPPGARRLLSSAFCENAGFTLGDNVFCLQGHPEFEPAFMRELLAFRKDDVSAAALQTAHDSTQTPPDNAVCADWIGGFFESQGKEKKELT